MVLAYAIVCPWEAVAVGNLLARALPGVQRDRPLHVAGQGDHRCRGWRRGFSSRAAIAWVNLRGHPAERGVPEAPDVRAARDLRASSRRWASRAATRRISQPLFARPGAAGAALSILLVLQIVPYFMTGFESVGKESEEARPGFDPRDFGRAILAAAGHRVPLLRRRSCSAVSFVFPWKTLVLEKLGTEAAFERAFGSRAIARWILFAALPLAHQDLQRQLRRRDAAALRNRPARPRAPGARARPPGARNAGTTRSR